MPGSVGPVGYADYQRTANYDSPLIAKRVLNPLEESESYGPFFCGRYANLGGRITVEGEPIEVQLQWFTAEKSVPRVGERLFTMDPNIEEPALLHIPNLGPWLLVTLIPKKAKGINDVSMELFLNNRTFPLEFVPIKPLLLARTLKLKSKEGKVFWPSNYYVGPMKLWIFNSQTTTVWRVESENTIGAFATIAGQNEIKTEIIEDIVLAPPGAWRLFVENGAASEAEVQFTLSCSLTGSS